MDYQHLSSSLFISEFSECNVLHLVVRSQANKSPKEVLQSSPLFAESVDCLPSRPGEGSLEPVTQDGHDSVEAGELFVTVGTVLNPGEEFSDDDEIDDQRGCEEGILANGVHRNGIASTHHELGMVFVHGDFGVSDRWDVFNNDAVIDSTADVVVEENLVGGDDVVDNGSFADFLRAELTGCRQILAIIVTYD